LMFVGLGLAMSPCGRPLPGPKEPDLILDPIVVEPVNVDPITPDSAVEVMCDAACRHMQSLGCPGWEGSPGHDEMRGTPDDIPCWVVCRDAESAAGELEGASMHPSCVAGAESCVEAVRCFDG